MRRGLCLGMFAVLLSVVSACNDAPSSRQQTILTGETTIAVDESLAPIVRDQLEVFRHSYTNADISLDVKPENQVVAALMTGQAEIAVLTRLLSQHELKFFEDRGFKPRVTKFATDAVALITHMDSADSTISLTQVLDVLRGNRGKKSLVFDNANSGTVRYLKELAKVDSLPPTGVYAVASNPEVVKYVHDHPGTIGVVGVNWLVRPDSVTRVWLEKVRTLPVSAESDPDGKREYYLPSQSNLATGNYPLSRPVYIINAEPRQGLGIGFAAFLAGDRGQRIILKSGLMPDSLPPRELIIRKK